MIELGAEAAVGQQDNWTDAQAELYRQLGQQLKDLWGNGHKVPEKSAEADVDASANELAPEAQAPEPKAQAPEPEAG